MVDAFGLGASLYVPATKGCLREALEGSLIPTARSLIVCTEDSIAECDLDTALARLRHVLPTLPGCSSGPLRFVRPRNPEILSVLLKMPGIERVHGFVLPKVDLDSLPNYERVLRASDHRLMPTLETAQLFDVQAQRELREYLCRSAVGRATLALRIGGNDLLRVLGMKRTRGVSIYETPIGLLIQQFMLSFRPHGFKLTGPVFDYLDDPMTLHREVLLDVSMGLVGKTAIHPGQIGVIEAALSVKDEDLRAAYAVLNSSAAVFRFEGAMIEKAVHTNWAQEVVARSAINACGSGSPPLNQFAAIGASWTA